MPELQHFDARGRIEDQLDALRKDGALIIDSVLDAADLARLRSETDPYMEATHNGRDSFTGRSTTRLS